MPVGDYISRILGDLLLGYSTDCFPITFMLTWAGPALIMKAVSQRARLKPGAFCIGK